MFFKPALYGSDHSIIEEKKKPWMMKLKFRGNKTCDALNTFIKSAVSNKSYTYVKLIIISIISKDFLKKKP